MIVYEKKKKKKKKKENESELFDQIRKLMNYAYTISQSYDFCNAKKKEKDKKKFNHWIKFSVIRMSKNMRKGMLRE